MKKEIKTILAFILVAGVTGTPIPVMAESVEEESLGAFIDDSFMETPEYSCSNPDSTDIKNKKAGITEGEVQAAKDERQIHEYDLGYAHDVILVRYDRSKVRAEVEQLGLEREKDLYLKDLMDHGDDYIEEIYHNDNEYYFSININDNKTVKTAVEEYSKLDWIIEAKPDYDPIYEIPLEVLGFRLNGIYPIYNNDSITLGCVHENAGKNTKYRWEYCKVGTNEWHLLSDWSTSEWCTWYPDANEDYAVVCKASYTGQNVVHAETTWYVSRPSMQKRITGRCALPTDDGILFGCTSTVSREDAGYLTTCYIWSFNQQTWITQSAYEASNCAWFRTSGLSKGTYMMYNCTEKRMPNGERRKLSCDYYLFNIEKTDAICYPETF